MSWTNSEAEAVILGGHLATINDAAEYVWVSLTFDGHLWIGFNNVNVEGNFEWVSGDPVTYTNWHPRGEPNNSGGMEHFAKTRSDGFWNDLVNDKADQFGVVEVVSEPATGDFDFDGNVDGNDFLVWQRGESPNPLSRLDLAEWEVNFGALASPITATSTGGPEPSTSLISALAAAALLWRSVRTMKPVWATAIAQILLVHPAFGLVTSDEHGSHVVTPGQPSFGLNLDGVVIVGTMLESGEPRRYATAALISDRHVLTAAHSFDFDGTGQIDPLYLGQDRQEIVFELTEGWIAVEYEVDSIAWPETWVESRGDGADLAVLTLVEDAPAGVPRYPLYGARNEVGQPFVMAGYGAPGHGSTGACCGDLAKRAGLNRYEATRGDYPKLEVLAYDFDSGRAENNSLELTGFESDLGFGGDEVISALGDSGGPTFINGAIAGVIAWGDRLAAADVNDELDSSWGEAGFDTRVSTFREFILNATDGQALFVIDGDYTKDGRVDGADFLLWQRQYGATDFPAADGNGDGTITAADLTLWADNFGHSTSPSALLAVPEPAAPLLVVNGYLALQLLRRQRVSCC